MSCITVCLLQVTVLWNVCHACTDWLTGDGPLQCTSCPPRSMLDGGLCVECLGSQYYDPPTQLCKSCHSSCHSCSGPGPFSCLTCVLPLHLDHLNNQCVPCCTSPNQQDCCHCDKNTGNLVATRDVCSDSSTLCVLYDILCIWGFPLRVMFDIFDNTFLLLCTVYHIFLNLICTRI
jgi:hypothetical protein